MSAAQKPALLDMSTDELAATLALIGEKPFRAKQITAWLAQYKPFAEMTNLSKNLREKLACGYREGYLETAEVLTSIDGTQKYLFKTYDDNLIETVRMTYTYGATVCISTQAGCAMGCAFCASAKGGLIRELTAGELLAQVLAVNAASGGGRSVKNIVLMGTGEPLANYDNTVAFLRRIGSEETLGVSMRNISLSTCGLVPEMLRFAEEGLPVTLSLSLHAATDEKRRLIMPIARRYTVAETMTAAFHYLRITGRRITLEYLLIAGFNDGTEDIDELIALVRGMNAHINVIPYNDANGAFRAPTRAAADWFVEALCARGISATKRRSLGADIAGACGQLRARHMQ